MDPNMSRIGPKLVQSKLKYIKNGLHLISSVYIFNELCFQKDVKMDQNQSSYVDRIKPQIVNIDKNRP